MRPNALKRKLAEGQVIANAWLTTPSSYLAEVLGHQGFDSITVDLQHGMIGFDAAVSIFQAISSTPCVPLARVAKNDSALIMQLLDAGAYGLVCPMIETVREAQDFVAWCRYPPTGRRSFGPARGLLYGGSDYFQHADSEILTLAMIETASALEATGEILDLDGLDGVYVGPNDLALSLGVPHSIEPAQGPARDALKSIAQAASARGKLVGTHFTTAGGLKDRLDDGYNMLTPGSEVVLLTKAAKDAVGMLRQGPV